MARRAPVLVALLASMLAAGCTTQDAARQQLALSTPEAATTNATPAPEAAAATASRATTTASEARRALTLPPELRAEREAQLTAAAPAAAARITATGSVGASATAAPSPAPAKREQARRLDLTTAVGEALMTYPEIRAYEARVRETRAGVAAARSALMPQGDLRLAVGSNYSGSYEGTTVPYKTSVHAVDGRADGGVILRQLLFDFGAARSDVERAELLRDAEKMRLREKIDDVAGKTAQAYLRAQESRALLGLVDEVIAAHVELARVVAAHAKEGHGTDADVQRVNARLIDVRAIRSDVSLQMSAAQDQLRRLTRVEPGVLAPAPDLRRRVPMTQAGALNMMLANNPRLAAIATTTRSSQKELEAQSASMLPRINLEVDTETKNFRNGPAGRTQAEARAMVAMRYRFLDGGLASANREQILARIEQGEFTYLNEREQMEADLRQAYRAIDSAARKLKLVSDGVSAARRVRELYLEQFKGGKRTVFELLDSQMSFFTIRRSQIENQFEGQRAIFEVLRVTGQLASVLAGR
jgi:TolC family type I secretion outer membrane protein